MRIPNISKLEDVAVPVAFVTTYVEFLTGDRTLKIVNLSICPIQWGTETSTEAVQWRLSFTIIHWNLIQIVKMIIRGSAKQHKVTRQDSSELDMLAHQSCES